MGAAFQVMSMDGNLSMANVRKEFHRVQEEDLYENGHSYSGGFGMAEGLRFDAKSFPDIDKAWEYLSDHTEKWSEAACVSYLNEDRRTCWLIGAWCAE